MRIIAFQRVAVKFDRASSKQERSLPDHPNFFPDIFRAKMRETAAESQHSWQNGASEPIAFDDLSDNRYYSMA